METPQSPQPQIPKSGGCDPNPRIYAYDRAYFKESLQLQRTNKFQTSKHFKISCQKSFISQNFRRPSFCHLQEKFRFHPQKILTTFFSHFFSISYVSAFQTLQVQLHKPTFCIIHSQNFTLFSILFYASPLFQFKIYNCTIPILQLQTTLYNCTNCHQLHVKICPDLRL